LTADYTYKGDKNKLACSYEKIASSVKPGQQILVADGSLVLTVLSCDEPNREVTCRVENNAAIGERKNMNLPGVKVDLPTFTDKDVKDIVDFGVRKGVEFIAASFVRTGQVRTIHIRIGRCTEFAQLSRQDYIQRPVSLTLDTPYRLYSRTFETSRNFWQITMARISRSFVKLKTRKV
jgi:pyruvate kinase